MQVLLKQVCENEVFWCLRAIFRCYESGFSGILQLLSQPTYDMHVNPDALLAYLQNTAVHAWTNARNVLLVSNSMTAFEINSVIVVQVDFLSELI